MGSFSDTAVLLVTSEQGYRPPLRDWRDCTSALNAKPSIASNAVANTLTRTGYKLLWRNETPKRGLKPRDVSELTRQVEFHGAVIVAQTRLNSARADVDRAKVFKTRPIFFRGLVTSTRWLRSNRVCFVRASEPQQSGCCEVDDKTFL